MFPVPSAMQWFFLIKRGHCFLGLTCKLLVLKPANFLRIHPVNFYVYNLILATSYEQDLIEFHILLKSIAIINRGNRNIRCLTYRRYHKKSPILAEYIRFPCQQKKHQVKSPFSLEVVKVPISRCLPPFIRLARVPKGGGGGGTI